MNVRLGAVVQSHCCKCIRPFLRLSIRHISHYDRLDIPITATKAEIKRAYLDKAKQCHPDVNPDSDAEKFQKIQEAHDVLMDSNARAHYNANMKQSSYYGTQQTHRNQGEEPFRPRTNPNIKRAGVNNPYTQRGFNPNYGAKHRTNQDNYSDPGSQKSFYQEQAPPFAARSTSENSGNEAASYLAISVAGGLLAYVVIQFIFRITQDAKHEMYKMKELKRKEEKAKRQKYQEVVKEMKKTHNDGLGPVKMTYDPEKKIFYTKPPDKSDQTDQSLQVKFNSVIQTRIGANDTSSFDDDVKQSPVEKPITKMDLFALKTNVRVKHKEYIAIKKEYNDMLEKYEAQKKSDLTLEDNTKSCENVTS